MAGDNLWSEAGSEPSVTELLADPVAQSILRYDRLTPEQVWSVVREARSRMAGRARRPRQTGREAA